MYGRCRGSNQMVGLLGVVSVIAGAAGAHWARWCGSRAEAVETCTGVLLVVGLGAIGAGLPHLMC